MHQLMKTTCQQSPARGLSSYTLELSTTMIHLPKNEERLISMSCFAAQLSLLYHKIHAPFALMVSLPVRATILCQMQLLTWSTTSTWLHYPTHLLVESYLMLRSSMKQDWRNVHKARFTSYIAFPPHLI